MRKSAAVALILVALSAADFSATATAAPTTTTLHDFTGKGDGGSPEGGVILGQDGVIYGAADRGGVNDNGVIFSLTPPATAGNRWSFRVLHRLPGGVGGGYPLGLTQDAKGNLYGYAIDFGAGNGTIFRLAKPTAPGGAWAFRTIYEFQGGKDGAFPSGLALQPDGSLIGTTDHGGAGACRDPFGDPPWGCGTVFGLRPPVKPGEPWAETVIHRFAGGTDGSTPVGAPVLVDGAWYGVTTEGGGGPCIQPGTSTVAGCGSVYALRRDARGQWGETIAYAFQGGAMGSTPLGPLAVDTKGRIYGVTASGGLAGNDGYGNGLVYELEPSTAGPLAETVLHAFAGGKDGYEPQSGLALGAKGRLYGTTYLGSSGNLGAAFILRPPAAQGGTWTEFVVARFSGPVGAYPTGQLAIDASGALYGVALEGGRFNAGTVFKVIP
jgi:hypothetical protein